MNAPAKGFKWIFFRVLNYIQIVVGLFIIVVVNISNWSFDSADISYFIAMLAFGVFVANGLSNIYLVERFFPNQMPTLTASRFNLVTYILLIIVSSLTILVTFAMFFSMSESGVTPNDYQYTALWLLISLSATSIPLWFLQIQLRTTLKRNQYAVFDQFLENEEE